MSGTRFEDLAVWQAAVQLGKLVYNETSRPVWNSDFAYRDQIRRAVVSVSANIAEGYERGSRKEYIQFLSIAKGSAGEVRSLVRLAYEIGRIEQLEHDRLVDLATELSRRLAGHIRTLRSTPPS